MTNFWMRASLRGGRRKDSEMIRTELGITDGQGSSDVQLKKCLTAWDVVAYGIASTVGSGIFITSGTAVPYTGPALFVSFLICGICCLCNALCYSEFSSRIPAAGSAYSYAYNALGEFPAFLMGVILFLEFGLSAAVTSRGVADNVGAFFEAIGRPLPDFVSKAVPLGGHGSIWAEYFSFSLLAPVAVALSTVIALRGAEESAALNLGVTLLNVGLILVFAAGGLYFSDFSKNYADFAPYGVEGILEGGGVLFFCYIGFDAVSTMSEEVKNPQRDIPIGILGTLGGVSAMYCIAAIVLTSMLPYTQISETAPLAMAFKYHGALWLYRLVALGSVTTNFCATLACLMGQPRIFFRMARDGLWPQVFGELDHRSMLPVKGIWLTGAIIFACSACLNLNFLLKLISAGTLLCYTIVCGGVMLVRYTDHPEKQITAAVSSRRASLRREAEREGEGGAEPVSVSIRSPSLPSASPFPSEPGQSPRVGAVFGNGQRCDDKLNGEGWGEREHANASGLNGKNKEDGPLLVPFQSGKKDGGLGIGSGVGKRSAEEPLLGGSDSLGILREGGGEKRGDGEAGGESGSRREKKERAGGDGGHVSFAVPEPPGRFGRDGGDETVSPHGRSALLAEIEKALRVLPRKGPTRWWLFLFVLCVHWLGFVTQGVQGSGHAWRDRLTVVGWVQAVLASLGVVVSAAFFFNLRARLKRVLSLFVLHHNPVGEESEPAAESEKCCSDENGEKRTSKSENKEGGVFGDTADIEGGEGDEDPGEEEEGEDGRDPSFEASSRNPSTPRVFFRCPGVPFVPLFGIFINGYLTASLGLQTLFHLFVYLLVGALFYFFYGQHNSTLSIRMEGEGEVGGRGAGLEGGAGVGEQQAAGGGRPRSLHIDTGAFGLKPEDAEGVQPNVVTADGG